MKKNQVSNVLDQNGVPNTALTRAAYRTLYPACYVYCLIKRWITLLK